MNEEAAVAEEEGPHARETAENYIGATVLFALVLFLVAVSQRFKILGVRIGAIALAVGCSATPCMRSPRCHGSRAVEPPPWLAPCGVGSKARGRTRATVVTASMRRSRVWTGDAR